jgi:hypothetical protein
MEKTTNKSNTMAQKRFNVEFVKRNHFPSGRRIKERVFADFVWLGTTEEVVKRAKDIVRPLFGSGEYGDNRMLSFSDIEIHEGGFMIWYNVQYFDEVLAQKINEEVVIQAIEM